MQPAAIIILAATFIQPTYAKSLEFDPYEPIILSVDLKLQDGETAVTWWRTEGQARYREIGGNEIAVWAPPGKHSIWLGATITKATTATIQTADGKSIEVVTGVSTRKAEYDYSITVRGPPSPDIPEVPDDPEPSPDFPRGSVSAVVIRDLDTQTPDQSEWLIKSQVELSKAGTQLVILEHDQDGIPSGYVKRLEADGFNYPAYFVVVQAKDKNHIVASGEVKTETTIAAAVADAKRRAE